MIKVQFFLVENFRPTCPQRPPEPPTKKCFFLGKLSAAPPENHQLENPTHVHAFAPQHDFTSIYNDFTVGLHMIQWIYSEPP